MEGTSKRISNVGIRARIKQILMLAIAILLGVIISSAVGAQDFKRANKHHFKVKYRAQIKRERRECALLSKKRYARPKTPLFAARVHKPKFKPQAEIDARGTGTSLTASSK
jgi:hypothetical protein